MFLSNLKIGKRLGLGFGTILMLLLIAILMTTLSLKVVDNNSKQVANKSLPYALLADEMVVNTVEVQQWLTDVSATHNPDGYKDAEEAAGGFRENMEKFKDMFRKENNTNTLKQMEELEADFNQFYETGKQMANAYITQGIDAGNKLMENFDETTEKLSKEVGKLRRTQTDEAEAMMQGTVNAVGKAQIVLLMLGGLTIILSLVIAFMISRSITRPLSNAVAVSNRLSKGDLTMQIEVNSMDETGQLLTAMKNMVENLKRIAGQITGAANRIASNSEETSATTSQITSGIEQQIQQTEQSAAATTEISQTIMDVARNASDASGTAKESVAVAEEGKKVVDDTVSGMLSIAQTVETSSKTIEKLGESSKQIGNIINVINDIADQTNLLALNAAIEAARAGEQGRGFAVVADEVRKLAERTGKATEEISGMIKKIQQDTEVSVQSMKEGRTKAEEGVKLAEKARESLDRIVQTSGRSFDMVQAIAAATEEQSTAVEEVSTTMENIADVSRTSQTGISQINTATNELAKLAGEFQTLVSWFKLDSRPAAGYTEDSFVPKTEHHPVAASPGNGGSRSDVFN